MLLDIIRKERRSAEEQENFLEFYYKVYNIVYKKIIPAVCAFGFLFNLISFYVFIKSKLKEKIYFYLRIKSLLETIMLGLGCFQAFMSCIDCNPAV